MGSVGGCDWGSVVADAALTVWPMRQIGPDAEIILGMVRDWPDHAAEIRAKVDSGEYIALRFVASDGQTVAVIIIEVFDGAGGLCIWVHQLAGDLSGVDLAIAALRTVERLAMGAGAVGMGFNTHRPGLVRRAHRMGFQSWPRPAGGWTLYGKFT